MLVAIAFVVPACFAIRLNRGRLMRAEHDVRALADAFDRSEGRRADVVGLARAFDMLVGPGDVPRANDAPALLWRNGRTDALDASTPDPWGHRYEINIGAVADPNNEPAAIWLLSAGPDGIVETPFVERARVARLRGDDIGIQIMRAFPSRR